MTIIKAPWQFIITYGEDSEMLLGRLHGFARGDIARFTVKDPNNPGITLGLWTRVSGLAHTTASCQAMMADKSYSRMPIYDFTGLGIIVDSIGDPMHPEPLLVVGEYDTGARTGGFDIID